MLLCGGPPLDNHCGQENCGSMIWGEVNHERRLKAVLLGFVTVVALLSVFFGVAAAVG